MKRHLFSYALFCVMFVFAGYAKTEDQHVVLAFGKTFNYDFTNNTTWNLSEVTSGGLLKSGKGPIRNLLFETPGVYQLHVLEEVNHDPETCNHPQYPENITITVSPFRLDFDFSTLRFSNEIVGGQSVEGTTLSVDVFFEAIENDSVAYEVASLKSSGVRTSIIGEPLHKQVVLKPGVNTLVYGLSGQAHSNTYIMFDFVDINGQPQVYNYSQKIR